MLADTWTGGNARISLCCMVGERSGLVWVERAYLEGKLPSDELLAFEAVIRGLPEQYEEDRVTDD